ncbi:MAG: TlpA family protein disulfide reductase [Deltaproteobacteria bacterium]|nr:TlpA family protein disulfide reductase [Deltaproteobacteria bacterium]
MVPRVPLRRRRLASTPSVTARAALVLATVLLAAPVAHAQIADRTVCVVSASPEKAEGWAKVLRQRRLATRVIDALDLDQVSNRPDLLACGAVFASSDSSLYWKGHPGAWKAASAHPLLLMGAAAELAPPHGAGVETARFVASSGRAITLSAAVATGLGLPTSLGREPDGQLALYKEDVPMRGLAGVDPRRATDLVAIGRAGSAPDAPIGVAVFDRRVLWSFAGTPEGLTSGGQALLAALVAQILPPDPADVARAEAAQRFSDDPADAPSPDDGESIGPSDAPPPRVLPAQASRTAPRLEFVKSFAGAPRSFDGLSGRVNLVVFWATWCGWCRKEMPEVQKLHDALSKRGVGVTAVSIDKRPATVDDFLRRGGFTFPTVVTTPGAQKSYGLAGVPSAVLLDKYGRIRASYVGASSFHLAQVEPAVATLLAGK